jgi:hypothetical protein
MMRVRVRAREVIIPPKITATSGFWIFLVPTLARGDATSWTLRRPS